MAISKNNLVMTALICVTAGISMPVAAQEPNCKEPQTQADMTICAGKDYEKADKELNVAYQKLRKLLIERDKAADADGKGATDALVTAHGWRSVTPIAHLPVFRRVAAQWSRC